MEAHENLQQRPPTFCGDLMKLPGALMPLTSERQWVIWRWENPAGARKRWTKVPYQAAAPRNKASSKNPQSWSSYQTAIAAHTQGLADGIGYMLADANLGAFDLDDCRDPVTGVIAEWAARLVEEADSYTEITVSGTGLRILGRATGSTVQRNQPVPETPGRVETYRNCNRYIVITGRPLPGSPDYLAPIDHLVEGLVERLDNGDRTERNTGIKPILRPNLVLRSLPAQLQHLIEVGVSQGDRSEQFHHAVCWLRDLGCTPDEIESILSSRPAGIGAKYAGRLRQEISVVVVGPLRAQR